MTPFLARHRAILLAYLGMIVLLLLTSFFSPGFLAGSHLRTLSVLAAFIGIVALGQTFVIIGGGIDLSVPWVLNCAAILMTLVAKGQNAPLLYAMPLILIVGALVGAVNGAGIAIFGVPPIIMTLAVNVILQGGILVYTGGTPPATAPSLIQFLAVGRVGPIPVVAVIWIVLAAIASTLLSKTAFGRQLYAVGTSATVAEFSGVPIVRTTVLAYTLSGFTAALAGMLLTGYTAQAYLGMGDPYLFTSIAAVAIGGASILGGSGHYIGTIAGAFVLTILTGLLPALNLSNGALLIVYGAVILLTVSLASEAFSDLIAAIRVALRRRAAKTGPTQRDVMIEIECVIDSKSELGEATYWDIKAEVLWWIDIYGPTIHRYDPATGKDDTWTAPEYLGTLSVRAKGGLVVSMVSGFYFFDPATGKFDPIIDPESAIADSRFNDGKTDRQGRFWSGSMWEAPGKQPAKIAALWRLDPDLSVHKVIDGVGCSNGLAWSPDSRAMYFTDSHTHFVWAYDFDPATGNAANRRVFIDLTEQDYIVDGSTVDAAGNYWLTVPFKGKILAYDPAGRLIQTIDLPFDLPTCCEFGGKDLDTLYVTSALYSRVPRNLAGQTKPGGLFAIRGLEVKGLPLVPFKG